MLGKGSAGPVRRSLSDPHVHRRLHRRRLELLVRCPRPAHLRGPSLSIRARWGALLQPRDARSDEPIPPTGNRVFRYAVPPGRLGDRKLMPEHGLHLLLHRQPRSTLCPLIPPATSLEFSGVPRGGTTDRQVLPVLLRLPTQSWSPRDPLRMIVRFVREYSYFDRVGKTCTGRFLRGSLVLSRCSCRRHALQRHTVGEDS